MTPAPSPAARGALVILRAGDTLPAVAARRGEFAGWIEAAVRPVFRGEIAVFDVRISLPAAAILGARGVIITGSASSVTERAGWMLETEALLREAVAARVPLFGLCFGHQILAQALGGEVARNPRGREIGTIAVTRLGDDPLFAGLPGSFLVNATHVDSVVRLPEGAVVLAQSELEPVAAFVAGSARGVQFHPEIDGDIMRGYLEARREILLAEGLEVGRLLAAARDAPAGAILLQNFVTRCLPLPPGLPLLSA